LEEEFIDHLEANEVVTNSFMVLFIVIYVIMHSWFIAKVVVKFIIMN
jgi:hypothetical protein